MEKKQKTYTIRVLISVAAVTALAGLLISFYAYRLTDIAVQAQKEASLDNFTARILVEIEHLEVTLETTIQIMNDEHIAIAKAIDYILTDATEEELAPQALQRLAEPLNLLELNIADANGILTHSNVADLIGFNYNDYETTRIYITLATGTLEEIREVPRQSVLGGEEYGYSNHYAGIPRTGGGFIQVGFDARIIWRLYEEFDAAQAIRDIAIGDTGFGMVVTDGVITAHLDSSMLGVDVSEEEWYQDVNHSYGFTWLEMNNARYYTSYKNENNHTIIGFIPEAEFYEASRDVLRRSLLLTLIAVAVIIAVAYMMVSKPVKETEYIISSE